MPEVITLGESMVMFTPLQNGPLRYVNSFQKRIVGAESNALAVTTPGDIEGLPDRDKLEAFMLNKTSIAR